MASQLDDAIAEQQADGEFALFVRDIVATMDSHGMNTVDLHRAANQIDQVKDHHDRYNSRSSRD